MHAAGTVPPGIRCNRLQRLASPTFQTPFSYTALPVWFEVNNDVPPAVRL